jgi:hypothetical protein
MPRKLDCVATEKAYRALNDDDREGVDIVTAELMAGYRKSKNPQPFGVKMARELLAKVYICITHDGRDVRRMIRMENEDE